MTIQIPEHEVAYLRLRLTQTRAESLQSFHCRGERNQHPLHSGGRPGTQPRAVAAPAGVAQQFCSDARYHSIAH